MYTTKIKTTVPYFYIITHLSSNKKYAGSRWAEGCHPSELLTKYGYKTSSLIVQKLLLNEGLHSFSIDTIITDFGEYKTALEYETYFLKSNNCSLSEEWLNMHNNDMNIINTDQSWEKIRQTNLEKFGVEYSIMSDIIKEKSKQTHLDRYGKEHYCQTSEGIEHIKYSHIKHHGMFYTQTDEFKYRIESTNLKKYGKWYTQTDECKVKMMQTTIDRYEVKYYTQSEEFRNLLNDKKPLLKCEYCCFETRNLEKFNKYHGDNCKKKPITKEPVVYEKPLIDINKKYGNHLPKCKQFPTLDFVLECVYYDDTKGKLIWKKRPLEHFSNKLAQKRFNSMFAEKEIYNTNHGIFVLILNKVAYHAADITWLINTCEPPMFDIKFKDGNTLNYCFENLEYSSHSNQTGIKGVYKKGDKFTAQIFIDGKNLSLGVFNTYELASEAYTDAKQKLIEGRLDEISFSKRIKKHDEITLPNVVKDNKAAYIMYYKNSFIEKTYIGRFKSYEMVEDTYYALELCTTLDEIDNIINTIRNNKNYQLKNEGLIGVNVLQNGKYKAIITVNGRTFNIGTYHTPEEAHQKYLKADAYRKIHNNLDGFLEEYYESLKVCLNSVE